MPGDNTGLLKVNKTHKKWVDQNFHNIKSTTPWERPAPMLLQKSSLLLEKSLPNYKPTADIKRKMSDCGICIFCGFVETRHKHLNNRYKKIKYSSWLDLGSKTNLSPAHKTHLQSNIKTLLSHLPRSATDFLCCNPLTASVINTAMSCKAGCRRCSDPSVECRSFAIRKPSASNSAPLAIGVWRGQHKESEGGEKALCSRQFGLIDMNHYRQHGRGRQRASHRFIFGHLFRQKLG